MIAWVVMAACDGPENTPTVDPPGAPRVIRCAPAVDNALRVWCDAELDAPAAVRVELTADGVPDRTFDAPVAAVHRILGWGLRAETTYRWTITDLGSGEVATGTVATGAVSAALDPLWLTVASAGALDADAVMLASDCPADVVLMVDGAGQIVWYEELDDHDTSGDIGGLAFSADGTVLVTVGRSTVLALGLDGTVWTRADRGVDFEDPVHHDILAADGRIWTLTSSLARVDGTSWIVDGVLVLDADGAEVDRFSIAGVYPLVNTLEMLAGYWTNEFPGAVDFSHANAVFVDPAGDVWLSFRHLHAFAKFRGGPGTPGFGELLWTAVGDPSSAIAESGDLVLVGDDAGFSGQHDVHLAQDGTVLVFDNGLGGFAEARGVRYALDEAAGTLTVVEDWQLDQICPTRGSLRELPGGDVLATCPAAGTIRAYGPDGWTWGLTGTCGPLAPAQFSRGIPITW